MAADADLITRLRDALLRNVQGRVTPAQDPDAYASMNDATNYLLSPPLEQFMAVQYVNTGVAGTTGWYGVDLRRRVFKLNTGATPWRWDVQGSM